MFGGHVLVTPTTSLGHLAVLPVLVDSTDAVLLDHQVHASVQMAANQLRVKGTNVDLVRHNNMERLEAMIERLATDHDRIWYMADGVYSMFADLAPFAELRDAAGHVPAADALRRRLARRRLGGQARPRPGAGRPRRPPARDRGVLAEQVLRAPRAARSSSRTPRCAAACKTAGGPMMFSGPVQPPLLGAAIESAKIHLSDELPAMQAALRERVELFTSLCDEYGIPLATARRDADPLRPARAAGRRARRDQGDPRGRLLHEPGHVPGGADEARRRAHDDHAAPHASRTSAASSRRSPSHVPAALERGGEAAKRRHAKIVGEHGPALALEHHTSASALEPGRVGLAAG